MLGPGLIQKEKLNNEVVFKPVMSLPNVIELSYYSNALVAAYALESVVAVAYYSLDRRTGHINQEDLIQACLEVCEMFQYEFLFCKPCQDLECTIIECINDLIMQKEILTEVCFNFLNLLTLVLLSTKNKYKPFSVRPLMRSEIFQSNGLMLIVKIRCC